MRIHFQHLGHANRCLKDCEIVLRKSLGLNEKQKIPILAVKNDLSKALGFNSLIDLTGHCKKNGSRQSQVSSVGDLFTSLIKGFYLAKETLKQHDIPLPDEYDAAGMAGEVLSMLEGIKQGEEHKNLDSQVFRRHVVEPEAGQRRKRAEDADCSLDERIALFREAIDYSIKNNLLSEIDESAYYAGQVLMAHFKPAEAHEFFALCFRLGSHQRIPRLTFAAYAASSIALGKLKLAREVLLLDAKESLSDIGHPDDFETAITERGDFDRQEGRRLLAFPECSGSDYSGWVCPLERFLAGDLDTARRSLAWARSRNARAELYLTGQLPEPEPYYEFRPPEAKSWRTTKAEREDHDARYCFSLVAAAWRLHPVAVEWLKSAPQEKLPVKARYKEYNPPSSFTFYKAVIEGREFEASLGPDGVHIHERASRSESYIGPSEIIYSETDKIHGRNCDAKVHWCIAKYGDSSQAMIDLCSLSDKGRKVLAKSFGLPMRGERAGRTERFYSSTAFESLCEWAKENPKKIVRYKGCRYLYNLTDVIAKRIGK